MTQTSWRLITDPPQSAAVNMAEDEAIAMAFAEGKSPSTLRLYQWDIPSFSIGAFQTLEKSWFAALENRGIPLVRRVTGGRGVLHDKELTYALVSSTTNPLFSKGIKGAFHAVAQGILKGLQPLGLEDIGVSKIRPARVHPKNPLCFDAVSWHEITAKGKKLVGSAQRRWKSHFLQHGSLILNHSTVALDADGLPGGSLISTNQMALSDLLPTVPPVHTLIQTLKEGFETALGIELQADRLSPYERAIIHRLIKEKYGSQDWNRYRKLPEGASF